jgi:hypothetical protein
VIEEDRDEQAGGDSVRYNNGSRSYTGGRADGLDIAVKERDRLLAEMDGK